MRSIGLIVSSAIILNRDSLFASFGRLAPRYIASLDGTFGYTTPFGPVINGARGSFNSAFGGKSLGNSSSLAEQLNPTNCHLIYAPSALDLLFRRRTASLKAGCFPESRGCPMASTIMARTNQI
jgi:hypothetical protein